MGLQASPIAPRIDGKAVDQPNIPRGMTSLTYNYNHKPSRGRTITITSYKMSCILQLQASKSGLIYTYNDPHICAHYNYKQANQV